MTDTTAGALHPQIETEVNYTGTFSLFDAPDARETVTGEKRANRGFQLIHKTDTAAGSLWKSFYICTILRNGAAV